MPEIKPLPLFVKVVIEPVFKMPMESCPVAVIEPLLVNVVRVPSLRMPKALVPEAVIELRLALSKEVIVLPVLLKTPILWYPLAEIDPVLLIEPIVPIEFETPVAPKLVEVAEIEPKIDKDEIVPLPVFEIPITSEPGPLVKIVPRIVNASIFPLELKLRIPFEVDSILPLGGITIKLHNHELFVCPSIVVTVVLIVVLPSQAAQALP